MWSNVITHSHRFRSRSSETCRLNSLAIVLFSLQSCFYIIKEINTAVFQTITSRLILWNSFSCARSGKREIKLAVQAWKFVILSSRRALIRQSCISILFILKSYMGQILVLRSFLLFSSICVCLLKFIPKLVFTSKYSLYIIFMSLFGLNAQVSVFLHRWKKLYFKLHTLNVFI